LRAHRTDSSVYGVASDGYLFDFVTIAHDGSVKISKRFDASSRHLLEVLGCLRHILEITASMSPNSTPEKGENAGAAVDLADFGMDVDGVFGQEDEDDAL
jgi:hypothetical protein